MKNCRVKHSIAKIVCKVCEKSFSTMEVFIRVNCNEIELKNKDLKNFSNDTLVSFCFINNTITLHIESKNNLEKQLMLLFVLK